jgi:pimeloyl-ACP methyl ester carboxylesterase
MKRNIARTMLVVISIATFCMTLVPAAQAQMFSVRKFRPNQNYARGSTPLDAQTPHLPVPVSPDIIWVQCPPDVAAAGASCGYLPVPLHHAHRDGESVNIYFEQYPHTNSGPAESAIFVNPGGPGVTTTGLRYIYIPLFAPNMDKHDMVLFDDRGRGQSGAIDCPSLQHGKGPSFDQEVADCAVQLADDDDVYGTGNVGLDTEALRVVLGYDKLDYYGASYGSNDVAAYATRFASHLRSVILDSPVMTPLPAFLPDQGGLRSVDLLCQRSPTCSADHHNPSREFRELVRSLRANPVSGTAYDANGNPVFVTMDEPTLFYIMLQNGEIIGTFTQETEVLAAAAALEQGDSLPLLGSVREASSRRQVTRAIRHSPRMVTSSRPSQAMCLFRTTGLPHLRSESNNGPLRWLTSPTPSFRLTRMECLPMMPRWIRKSRGTLRSSRCLTPSSTFFHQTPNSPKSPRSPWEVTWKSSPMKNRRAKQLPCIRIARSS